MDESTLNKPVNLKNLSLALAKTRSAISGEIVESINNIPRPNWYAQEITDAGGNTTDYEVGYIGNKPPVMGDTGNNSVNLNSTTINAGYAIGDHSTHIGINEQKKVNLSLKLTGDANATTYTYEFFPTYEIRTRGLLETFDNDIYIYISASPNNVIPISSIDMENSTITVATTLSEEPLSAQNCGLVYRGKAFGAGAVSVGAGRAIGSDSVAINGFSTGNYSFTVGLSNKAEGTYAVSTGYQTVASALYSRSGGQSATASGLHSVAEGRNTIASGNKSYAMGSSAIATADASHAIGFSTKASGFASHSEGLLTITNGEGSHSEGRALYGSIKLTGSANSLIYSYSDDDADLLSELIKYNLISNYRVKISLSKVSTVVSIDPTLPIVSSVDLDNKTITLDRTISETKEYDNQSMQIIVCNRADGNGSHSEGLSTLAYGEGSHAEGRYSNAYGARSHAEGNLTQAKGESSHAQGVGTIAAKHTQFTLGTFNIEDNGTSTHPHDESYGQYAVILGNGGGTDNRSNAHTIDWTGKGWFANTVSAGTIATPATVVNANDLTTKAYVDSAVTSSLSLNGNVITLTNSNGATSTITLPVYNGGVTT